MRDKESNVDYLSENRLRKIEEQVKRHKSNLPEIFGFCAEDGNTKT